MTTVEPVVNEPAATVMTGEERYLLIADYHAGIERALRIHDGVSIESRASNRRQRLLDLIAETSPDRVIVLGDLMHSIGDPTYSEREEITRLVEAVSDHTAMTVVKGNHDGDLEEWITDVEVVDAPGCVCNGLALSHGHTWPPASIFSADVLCIGHEHPQVRLEDSVGGSTVHQVWIRGRMRPSILADAIGESPPAIGPELVVMPSFNEISGGTWVNETEDPYLVPYLPDGLIEPQVYLLDGTNLGLLSDLSQRNG